METTFPNCGDTEPGASAGAKLRRSAGTAGVQPHRGAAEASFLEASSRWETPMRRPGEGYGTACTEFASGARGLNSGKLRLARAATFPWGPYPVGVAPDRRCV
ncbi:hypothetical protein NDU88_008741 [Pleurodeles waltl]|uniref:Uncharacterized protein n=1 Tax=Pleurodeles waltl TaxID=8319 RepID=A0AAV7PQ69_PLEWA|nr:hypothetical protein NDU88_008741 [Pleurodeles waltl]